MKTKVIFRKFPEGDIIALFPEIPGSMNPIECLCYQHIGQHGSANTLLIYDTKPATAEEFQSLYNEISNIGYDLQICKRISRKMDLTRIKELSLP